jgi:hypothetical protein
MTSSDRLRARVFGLAQWLAAYGIDADTLALSYADLAGLCAVLRHALEHSP